MLRSMLRGVMGTAAMFAVGFSLAGAADKEKDKAKDQPPRTEPMTVYDNGLGTGWENWSWAKTEVAIELTGSPRKPIKIEAEGWQALYLHHEPFNTSGLRKLGFLIQGSVPDREVRVFTVSDGKPNGEGKLVKFSNSGWTKVEVPLATLAAEDKVIDGLWVQNASADVLPKFYVTEIRLD
jgi:hypothetical protein